MRRLWPFLRTYGFDLLIVLAAAEAAVEVALRHDADGAPDLSLWVSVPATALVILPLLARRRFPFGAPAGVWLLAGALSFVDGRLVVFTATASVAGLAAAFLLGRVGAGLQARLGLLVVLGSAATIVYNNPTHATAELVFSPLLFAVGWVAGYVVRERAEQAEAAEERATRAELEREAAARVAVAEERARIARELHDIVAHAVSVMVLQVGAVRHRLPAELGEDADALRGVETTGRTALAEMRRLLGAMRRDGDGLELGPQPGLDAVDALLAEVGRAGLPAELHVEGQPAPLPRAIDLSAYRIVQEGLTNALKHARASRVGVTLRYGAGELRIEVRDDGRGGAGSDGAGYGLVGIRERVKIYGGEMTAGAAPEGGFVLTARLPLEGYPR
ncbi:MAG TPA: sensor histidine kinase [Gaiellaceae bacterium]|nr:sensor histidine kinase [Gaiellaceae bacterium]